MSDFVVVNTRVNGYNNSTSQASNEYVDMISRINVIGDDVLLELSVFDSKTDEKKCSLSKLRKVIDDVDPDSIRFSINMASLYLLKDQIDLAILKGRKLREDMVLKS